MNTNNHWLDDIAPLYVAVRDSEIESTRVGDSQGVYLDSGVSQ